MAHAMDTEKKIAHKDIVEKHEGRRRHRWEDNITMDLQETRQEEMTQIDLDQDRDKWCDPVSTVMNLQVA